MAVGTEENARGLSNRKEMTRRIGIRLVLLIIAIATSGSEQTVYCCYNTGH